MFPVYFSYKTFLSQPVCLERIWHLKLEKLLQLEIIRTFEKRSKNTSCDKKVFA